MQIQQEDACEQRVNNSLGSVLNDMKRELSKHQTTGSDSLFYNTGDCLVSGEVTHHADYTSVARVNETKQNPTTARDGKSTG